MTGPQKPTLTELRSGTPFVSYAYSYPHKLAYRSLNPNRRLGDVWQEESRSPLCLYLHIPFCEYRCGFCNLFTQSQPQSGLPEKYLVQLQREAAQVRAALGNCQFSRIAIGGGTPTFLNLSELQHLWKILHETIGTDSRAVPTSIEASPATIDAEKLAFLREQGVERLSLGVQSFQDKVSRRLGRPQTRDETRRALAMLHEAQFPVLNLDLIYGAESESLTDWCDTVQSAIDHQPQELYLYPLYVREQTGLGRRLREWDDVRLRAYRSARELLLTSGYHQVSFRMFSRSDSLKQTTPEQTGRDGKSADGESSEQPAPVGRGVSYECLTDGMVGLGCGARSYTTSLHYSTEYAVSQGGVKTILGEYLKRATDEFSVASHGYFLDQEERQRRFIILSLLQDAGLNVGDFRDRFQQDPFEQLPELDQLVEQGLATRTGERLRLTAEGMEWSDAIGPWLYSIQVQQLIEERVACLT